MRRLVRFVAQSLVEGTVGVALLALIVGVYAAALFVWYALSRWVWVLPLVCLAGCGRLDAEVGLIAGAALCGIWILVGVVRVALHFVLVVVVLVFLALAAAGCDGMPLVVTSKAPDAGAEAVPAMDAVPAIDSESAVDAKPRVPICGSGQIVIMKTCNYPESGEPLCQEAEPREGLVFPCAVPNLHRIVVSDCASCDEVLR